MKTTTKYWLLAVLSGLLLSACSTSPTGRNQFLLVSPEAAIVQSQKAYVTTVKQLERENKLLNDPVLAERVALITGRVVTEAIKKYPHTADWDWSVALIDAPETVNAWCMAGGRMAVYSGLFKKLKLTDDEFAQIMGHEISHALANHTAERMSVAMASGFAVAVVGAAAKDQGVQKGAEMAAVLAVQMPNSRAGEKEADLMGTELAALAGYKPRAAVTLWEKMEEASGDGPPEFLSTHPSPGNRRAKLTRRVSELNLIRPPVLSSPHPVKIIY